MAKQYLVENVTIDCSKDLVEQRGLMESLEDRNILVEFNVEKDGKVLKESKKLKVLNIYKCPISKPGVMNKNKRKYTKETWEPVIRERQGEGSLGLLNHPEAGNAPDIEKTCCVWRNHRFEHDPSGKLLVCADMYIIDDKKGNGDLIESIIKAGGRVDLSTRGYGDLDETQTVKDYTYKSTDVVYQGSYGVQIGEENSYNPKTVEESTQNSQNTQKLKEQYTNNKIEDAISNENKGVFNMSLQKVLVRESIKSALKNDNKFEAYTDLETIYGDIKDDTSLSELTNEVKNTMKQLKEALTDVHNRALQEVVDTNPEDNKDMDGDGTDMGTAENPNEVNPNPPTKKVLPTNIHNHAICTPAETGEEGRGPKTAHIKMGGSEKAMEYEVKTGEVSVPTTVEIGEDTDIFTDSLGNNFVITENNEVVYITFDEEMDGDGDDVGEIEDEETEVNPAIPSDVHNTEVDDIEDTDATDRGDMTAMVKNGSGMTESRLKKLTKENLIDMVLSLDESIAQLNAEAVGMAEYTIRLENYAMMSEKTLEEDVISKQEAQAQIVEATEYVKSLKEQLNSYEESFNQLKEYAETLEEAVSLYENESENKENVLPYVAEMITVNPSLKSFQEELMNSKTIHEVQEKARKYNKLGERYRLDIVPTQKQLTESVVDSKKSVLKQKGWI